MTVAAQDMPELLTRLKAVQCRLKAPKNQYNSFGKYKYRSCEDILEALKPLLDEQGLTLVVSDEIETVGTPWEDNAGHTHAPRVYVHAVATVHCGDASLSGHGYAREDETKKGMDGSQVTGTASSYARKYALNGLFLIDDTKDADATNTHGKQPQAHAKARPAARAGAKAAPVASVPPQTEVISDAQLSEMRGAFGEYRDRLGVPAAEALRRVTEEAGVASMGADNTPDEYARLMAVMLAGAAGGSLS